MKIDLIITELAVGGAEQCLSNLAEHLHREGHEVRVFSIGTAPKPDRDRLLRTLQSASIDVQILGANRWWRVVPAMYKFWRSVRRHKPDVAQSFLFHANVVSAIIYGSMRIPLVGGVRVVDPRKWRSWVQWLASLAMTRVVCVSESVALHCRTKEGIAAAKILTIQNGIAVRPRLAIHRADNETKPTFDETESSPTMSAQRQLGLSETTPCLLFVGRIDHQKGADVLIDSATELLDELPLHHLIVVGDGPMKVELQTRASDSRHEGRIHFVGRQNRVLDWMQSSDLLLLPTRYEGMPNVVLEAMACGLPIVSTRAEGVVELLGNAAADQTVAVGDWIGWKNKVVEIARDPVLQQKLSQVNLDRCQRYFDLEEKMRAYESLYEQLMIARLSPEHK